MIKVEKSVTIQRPVEDVFNYITAEGNYATWQAGVADVINADARNTVGAQFTEVRKFMGQEMRTTLQITAFEPNAKWAAKVVKGPVQYEVTVTLNASDGGTNFTTHIEGEPKGFFKIAENLVAGQLEKSITEDGLKLKELLEKA